MPNFALWTREAWKYIFSASRFNHGQSKFHALVNNCVMPKAMLLTNPQLTRTFTEEYLTNETLQTSWQRFHNNFTDTFKKVLW